MLEFEQHKKLQVILEKQIVIGSGQNYGQVVIMIGGSGSGKSFAITNFLDFAKFKIFDPDKLKEYFIKTQNIFDEYPELKNFSFKNPEQVNFLHGVMRDKQVGDRIFTNLVKSQKESQNKANLIIDITLKDFDDLVFYADLLQFAGYEPKNIHLIWVLNDYNIAIQQNKARDRTLPDDVIFKTHTGASNSVWGILNGKLPDNVDGGVYVVLSHKEHIVSYKEKPTVIKDFKYLTVKQPGSPITTEYAVQEQLWDWIVKYIPISKQNSKIFGSGRINRKLYTK